MNECDTNEQFLVNRGTALDCSGDVFSNFGRD